MRTTAMASSPRPYISADSKWRTGMMTTVSRRKGVFTGNSENGRAMVQHEFGHVLQYRIVGEKNYYRVIAKESLLNCSKIKPYDKIPHDEFWTETWANYLSKQYFGVTWHGLDTYEDKTQLRYYPARNITKSFMREKFGM